jgi:hypothetical protein
MEWVLNISYGLKVYLLKAVVEYKSIQIMRIRVYGKTSTILLENNFPLLYYGKSKAAVKWKIREGQLNAATQESSQLLINIFSELEKKMKEYHEQLDREKFGFN